MFNKELFEKICDVSCDWSELEKFVINIDKKEFDLNNAFEKYYNVERIICAIEKYRSKKINAKFFAYWSTAYDWIINSGFKIENNDKSVSLKEFLIFEISDWLDSLSFFDDSDDWYDLEEYKNTFKVLDFILQDIDDCEAIYAVEAEDDEDDDYYTHDVTVLIKNVKEKYFIKLYTDCIYPENNVLFTKVLLTDLESQEGQLQKQEYIELKYCGWEDKD
jgi:hypothetical protein